MSPNRPQSGPHPEPSNAELGQKIDNFHVDLVRRLGIHDDRLRVLEHHIVDPEKPERTLPIRVRTLEKTHRILMWVISIVTTAVLTAGGGWIGNRLFGTEPSNKASKSTETHASAEARRTPAPTASN